MSLLAMAPAIVLWLIGRNSFARLFGVKVRSVVILDGPTARRVLATIGGSASAMLLASGLMLILFELAGALEPSAAPMVGAVMENMPAAAAGLQRGDEILTIAGQPVKSLGDVSAMIDRTQGKPVAVDVLRDGERREVTLQAKADGEHYRVGIELEAKEERVQLSFADSARRAARFPVEYSRYLASSLWRSVAGSSRAEFSGPIGVVRQERKKQQQELSLDLLFSLPAIGAIWVGWLGLPIGFLLLALGRSRARDARA